MKNGEPHTAVPTGAMHLFFENASFLERMVSADWMMRHNPVVGGYWVQYPDGYESFSPERAFEGGYTLIPMGEGNDKSKLEHRAEERSISEEPLLRYFSHEYFPQAPQVISAAFSKLAFTAAESVTPSVERNAGMRKLLEAKDCFIRAALSRTH